MGEAAGPSLKGCPLLTEDGELRTTFEGARGEGDKPRPWRLIGQAMGMSGQAVGKWTREHGLPVEQPDEAAITEEIRALVTSTRKRWPRRRNR